MSRHPTNEQKAEYGFVYMLFADACGPAYVGRTLNPFERLAAHFTRKQSAIKGLSEMETITEIWLAHVGNGQDAIALEAGLILKNQHPLNSQIGCRIQRNALKFNDRDYKWVKFTPQEFQEDHTIIYRCFA